MRRLLALMLLMVLATAPALASDPASGEVSKATPKVTWEGAVTSFQSWQTYNAGHGQCIEPSCDTFTLDVKDAAPLLTVTVESGDSTMFVEVVKPDGTKELFSGETKAIAKLKNPATGSYTINVAQNEQTQAVHKGTAELTFPSTAPPAPTTPPSSTTPPPAADTPPPTLSVKAGRLKGKSLPVTIRSSATVANVKATLLRGRKVIGRGSLEKINGSAQMKLRLKGRPKRGKHTLKVTAMDEQGRSVSKTLTVKI
jgi:hypothetical protein